METKFVRLKKCGSIGQILWVRDGLYKITYNHNIGSLIEIFIEEEFDFVENPYG